MTMVFKAIMREKSRLDKTTSPHHAGKNHASSTASKRGKKRKKGKKSASPPASH